MASISRRSNLAEYNSEALGILDYGVTGRYSKERIASRRLGMPTRQQGSRHDGTGSEPLGLRCTATNGR
jgi:hypothetical protein